MTDDDPRRHLRVRLVAAQLLLHTVQPPLGEDGPDMFEVITENCLDLRVTHFELLRELVHLIAKHAGDRDEMTRTLRTEIADNRLYLESVRMDGK